MIPLKLQRIQRVRRSAGISLVEVLTTVGVIGVLTAVSITLYTDTWEGSKEVIAEENAERLNSAVWKYNQIKSLVSVAGDNSVATDEAQVLALLQTRDAINMPGSPYLTSSLTFENSGSSDDFRLLWNGKAFEVAIPGDSGTGIKVKF